MSNLNTNSSTRMIRIPPEIVYQILSFQFEDIMSNDHPPNSEKFQANLQLFLKSNLTVSKTFYHISKVLAYCYLNFMTARGFHKLLKTLKNDKNGLANLIQVADFQELTSIGLGRTGEMNKMIKNLTSETLLEFLDLTKGNLREFLASEHIQEDLDARVIWSLLRSGSLLNVIDICGCSGSKFTHNFIKAVEDLYSDTGEPKEYNYQIVCLGLNDCTDIPSYILGKLLKTLPELQKLDLTHTSIDDQILVNELPHWKNLTHLSLGESLQLSPRAVLEFFSYHPAVTDENNSVTLQWLNLQVHRHSSIWTEVQTMFLLKKLCKFRHNKTLQYLNIDGLPLHFSDDTTIVKMEHYYQCQDTLQFIKWNFPNLKSLSIKDSNASYEKIIKFLSPLTIGDYETRLLLDTSETNSHIVKEQFGIPSQQLKFLNLTNNPYINKWTIQDTRLFTCSASLVAIELSFEPWQQIEYSNKNHEIRCMKYNGQNSITDSAQMELVIWKCYIDSSYGRRYWIFKTDPILNRDDLDYRGSITRYNKNGDKIIDIVKQPDFLKYAQNKIMLGCGILPKSSVRRKKTYRDISPPISRFLKRNGQLSMGGVLSHPTMPPRLPPGGWRIIHNEEDISEDESDDNSGISTSYVSTLSSLNNTDNLPSGRPLLPRVNTRDGLYWDRSITNLQQILLDMSSTETEAYLNDPDLQRRRSQLSLFRMSTTQRANSGVLPLQVTSTISNSKRNSYDRSTFVYDLQSPETNQEYLAHFQVVDEYEVFGCVERGMYRYYSLKT